MEEDEAVNVKLDGKSRTVPQITTTTTDAVSFFGKFASMFTAYEAWVRSHTGLARNVETTLYVAPQLVPKHFVEPEVATQFGYSLVGLIRLYHDYILWKKDNKEMESLANWSMRLFRVPLSLISQIQVLAEVVARRVGGDVGKWRLIVWLEVMKAVLRLALLAQRRRLMLIRGGKYNSVESAHRSSAFALFTKAKEPGTRTGKTFGKPNLSDTAGKKAEEANKISFEDATIEVAEGSREEFLVAGEICHILRPVVYTLLRRRRSADSWTPLVASLVYELIGLALSAAAVKPVNACKTGSVDKAAKELAARKMALLLYMIRDPAFEIVTKPVMEKTADVLDHVPGVGKLFRFGATVILDYYHQLYFYTSAS